MERIAYHSPNIDCVKKIKSNLHEMIHSEIQIKCYKYQKVGKLTEFVKLITHANALYEKADNGGYRSKNLFPEHS